ncbi:SH3 domain-containing protein [Bacillus sp. 31A1R]|uniref:SH3 domain-containing protein n=1 Tax=Robertmurraya mangrovi TaxID=3098077 RepID=A0ABU5ITB2_9BACI|nr:SH3 domain-containing protein [Bacillus sp. 31A1R]MDZ5470395.1 SH3 domain-containing protein [Bacillus sp. 31A1R]
MMKNLLKSVVLTTSLTMGITAATTGLVGIQSVEAATTVKISKTAYQTTDNLNLRKGAGTNYSRILTIPKGKTIYATERKGTWYKVSYTYKSNNKSVTKTGWVSGSYIKKKSTSSASTKASSTTTIKKTTFQTTVNLRMRTGPSTNYKQVYVIPKGKTVTSKEKKGTWYKVSYTYKSNGKSVTKTGWVSGKYIKEYYKYTSTSSAYYWTNKPTKLYSTPDRKKQALASVGTNNGYRSTQQVVNSLGETWYRVTYNGKNAYVYSKDVNKYSTKKIDQTKLTATEDTYVYASYGRGSKKLTKVTEGDTFTSTYMVGKWYKVSLKGDTGYVFKSEFKATEMEVLKEEEIASKTHIVDVNLNLRKSPNEDATILGTIPAYKIVFPTHKVSNGWYKLTYGGKTGYVSGDYIQEVKTGNPLTTKKSYQFIDLRTKSPVKASQINNYIEKYVELTGKKSVLTDKGQVFIDAGNKYGVNPLFLAAHAIHESAYGTSAISLGKYNLFGFAAYDAAPYVSAYRFKNVDANIEYIARELKATYLNSSNWKHNGYHLGFTTKTMKNARINEASEGMNFYYASDQNWGKAIAAHMQKMLPYDHSYYSKAEPNTTVYTSPSIPSGSDKFPEEILAVAKQSLTLKEKKGSSTTVKTIKKGTEFFIAEKTNDFWVKIVLEDEVYWTNDIKLHQYKEYLSVINLGRSKTEALNVREKATTANNTPINKIKMNQYVHIVLNKDNKPTMDSSKTWYKVELPDGTKGWVSAQYIALELK